MMRIRWPATADEAGLFGDIAEVLPVAITPWRSNGEDAFVDALRVIRGGAFGASHLRACNLRQRRFIVRGGGGRC
jgi:hypothetical protein